MQYTDIELDLLGFDACFFCLGVTSSGMSEAQYQRVPPTASHWRQRSRLPASIRP